MFLECNCTILYSSTVQVYFTVATVTYLMTGFEHFVLLAILMKCPSKYSLKLFFIFSCLFIVIHSSLLCAVHIKLPPDICTVGVLIVFSVSKPEKFFLFQDHKVILLNIFLEDSVSAGILGLRPISKISSRV